MKRNLYLVLAVIAFFMRANYAEAQVVGKWRTVDDTDGREKSIVEIFEKSGKLYGRVDRLLEAADKTICDKCPGELKNKPITGMVILTDLIKSHAGGTDGKILDPASGKTYTCFIELENPDTLKLRGYIGLPAFGRTQYWYRVKA